MLAVTAPQATTEDYLLITGGVPLQGCVSVLGAKNAALPALVAACLSSTPTTLSNIPTQLKDVEILCSLLRQGGVEIEELDDTALRLDGRNWQGGMFTGPAAMSLRHSLLLLGLSAYYGRALTLGQTGGCDIGMRKHDLHLLALRDLGYALWEDDDLLTLEATSSCLQEAPLTFVAETASESEANISRFHYPSFGATLNFIFAALAQSGSHRLFPAALNPEVHDVITLLQNMGAQITLSPEGLLTVEGGHKLQGTRYGIMGDRIVAATYLAAAGATKGKITVEGVKACCLTAEIAAWQKAGLDIESAGDHITATYLHPLRAVDITTSAYPGFHTDIQPLHGVLMALALGESEIRETIIDHRFGYATQLTAMGADIALQPGQFICANGAPGYKAIINGVSHLTGGDVVAPDIRGSAALLIAALSARGQTKIHNLYQLDRGYSNIESALRRLGAQITRERK